MNKCSSLSLTEIPCNFYCCEFSAWFGVFWVHLNLNSWKYEAAVTFLSSLLQLMFTLSVVGPPVRLYTFHWAASEQRRWITMAWRFKASKYKNAAPIVPKPEACVRDVCVGSYQTYGNNICASASFMAFNWEHVGSSMAVLPLDDCGRKSKTMPLLHAHSDTITSSEFSPFHDGLLMTGSQDALVRLLFFLF